MNNINQIDDQIFLIDEDNYNATLYEDEPSKLINYSKNSNQITQALLQAMQIVSHKQIIHANFNKIVKGIIVACEDESLGKYKVQYQDGIWYAYNENLSNQYIPGTSVYIMIPNSDMQENKIIIGSSKQIEQTYISIKNQLDNFVSNGYNLLSLKNSNQNSWKLWSEYPQCVENGNEIILYQDGNSNSKLIFNSEVFNDQKSSIDKLLLQATIQTMLPPSRQYGGNYGIGIDILFMNNEDNNEIQRSYILDVDNIIGDPYVLTNPTKQKLLFEIDGTNFIKINKIYLFVKDFTDNPENDKGNNYNIIISNLSLTSGREITETEKNGVLLTLKTEKGTIFGLNSAAGDTRQIQAQIKIQMKNVDLKTQKVPFYWFIQNVKVTSHSDGYSKYGGQGWYCLNKKSQKINNETTKYIADDNKFIVKWEDVYAKEVKYKCVIQYNQVLYSKEFTIKKLNAEYNIEIISDKGFDFRYDSGRPTLTCVVTKTQGELEGNFEYAWSSTNKIGNFTSLPSVLQLQNSYAQQVYQNKIYHLNISKITGFAVFKCSVFTSSENGGICIGTASAVITNKLQSDVDYSVVINNGTQVFLYNEQGISPYESGLENYATIPALTYTIYNEKGQPLSDQAMSNIQSEWIVPSMSNSMLIIPNVQNSIGQIAEDPITHVKTFYNRSVFTYSINKNYYPERTQNNITLKVKYNGMTLTTKTDFVFSKQGNPGTNGTQYQVRIVPNTEQDISDRTPMIYFEPNGNRMFPNWIIPQPPQIGDKVGWFKVEIWQNGEEIFSNFASDNDKNIQIIWKILSNNQQEKSYFQYNNSTDFTLYGIPSLNNSAIEEDEINFFTTLAPANILQAEVIISQGDTKLKCFATFPIITVRLDSGMLLDENELITQYNQLPFHIKLESGFNFVQYKSDGTAPSYNTKKPFKISIEKKQNNVYTPININNLNDTVWYTKSSYGIKRNIYKYEYEIDKWKKKENFIEEATFFHHLELNSSKKSSKDQLWIKCKDKYDGLVKTEAVIFQTKIQNKKIRVHIPIHLLLNRYFNTDLNDWDGNSIDLGNNQKDIILTPQLGAGQKDNQNRFTGLIMGKVQKNNIYQTGLFGYYQGIQTIAMDAKTGKTILGKSDSGQIEIDPSNGAALIKSGDYNSTIGTGMLINFSQGSTNFLNRNNGNEYTTGPEIKFGSGNFSVDKKGYLISKGGGSIGGWNITNTNLISANKKTGMSSQGNKNVSGAVTANFIKPDFNKEYILNWKKGGRPLTSSGKQALQIDSNIEYRQPIFIPQTNLYNDWYPDSDDPESLVNSQYAYMFSSLDFERLIENVSLNAVVFKLILNNNNLYNLFNETQSIILDEDGNRYSEFDITEQDEGNIWLQYRLNKIKIESFIMISNADNFEGTKYAIESSIKTAFITKTQSTLQSIQYSKSEIQKVQNDAKQIAYEKWGRENEVEKLYLFINLEFMVDNNGDGNVSNYYSRFSFRNNFVQFYKDAINITNNNIANGNADITSIILDEDRIQVKYLDTVNVYNSENTALAFWAKNLADKNTFYVSHDGYLIATAASIGGGTNPIYIGRSPILGKPGQYRSAIFSNKKYKKDYNLSGFYLGEDGLGIGRTEDTVNNKTVSKFQVDNDGTFYASEGYIGSRGNGWTVKANKMYNKAKNFENQGFFMSPTEGLSIKDSATNDNPNYFSVTGRGVMKASYATIGGWLLQKDHFRSGQSIDNVTRYPTNGFASYDTTNNNSPITISANYYDGSGSSYFVQSPKNIYIDNNCIRMGSLLHFSNNGFYFNNKIYATNLQIPTATLGGWVVNGTELYNGNITLNNTNKSLELGSVTLYGGDIFKSASNFRSNAVTNGATFDTNKIQPRMLISPDSPSITLRGTNNYYNYMMLHNVTDSLGTYFEVICKNPSNNSYAAIDSLGRIRCSGDIYLSSNSKIHARGSGDIFEDIYQRLQNIENSL